MARSGQSQDLNPDRLVCAPYKVPLLSEPHVTAHLRIPPEFPVTPGRHRTSQGHGPWDLSCFYLIFKRQNFPGGSVVKNPPANAGDMGLNPSLGRSHLLWDSYASVLQLLKPLHPRARALQQEKPPQGEACSLQLESSLSSHAAMKTQRIQKLTNERKRKTAGPQKTSRSHLPTAIHSGHLLSARSMPGPAEDTGLHLRGPRIKG